VIVTLDPPELVSVSEAVWFLPVCTLPKLTVDGLAVSAPGVVPLPESAIAREAFDALLLTLTPPVTAPLVCGANAIVKLVLCPAARVSGKVIPLTVNPEPVAVTCEMFTLDPPELVSVSDAVWLFPVCTLPKLTVEGLAVSAPAVVPVPESAIAREAFDALLVTLTAPVTAPLV
jgi:hypothetical protein